MPGTEFEVQGVGSRVRVCMDAVGVGLRGCVHDMGVKGSGVG